MMVCAGAVFAGCYLVFQGFAPEPPEAGFLIGGSGAGAVFFRCESGEPVRF